MAADDLGAAAGGAAGLRGAVGRFNANFLRTLTTLPFDEGLAALKVAARTSSSSTTAPDCEA